MCGALGIWLGLVVSFSGHGCRGWLVRFRLKYFGCGRQFDWWFSRIRGLGLRTSGGGGGNFRDRVSKPGSPQQQRLKAKLECQKCPRPSNLNANACGMIIDGSWLGKLNAWALLRGLFSPCALGFAVGRLMCFWFCQQCCFFGCVLGGGVVTRERLGLEQEEGGHAVSRLKGVRCHYP